MVSDLFSRLSAKVVTIFRLRNLQHQACYSRTKDILTEIDQQCQNVRTVEFCLLGGSRG